MTTANSDPEQGELISALLDGADPDHYVVISAAALEAQVRIAFREESRAHPSAPQHGRAAYRLMRNLAQLGFTVNTRRTTEVPG